MKQTLILILTTAFFYSMFWNINIINVLFILLGIGLSLALYRIPTNVLLSLKYPLIIAQFVVTTIFLIYPHLECKEYFCEFIVFISFYSILFYLVSLKEKEKSLYKEVLAISILFFSAFFNLFMVNKPVIILSIGIPIVLFLFIIGHNKVIPFIASYVLIIAIALIMKNIPIVGKGFNFNNDIQRYILILTPLLLFVWSFVGFVKDTDAPKVISFMVFLYIMLDIFITVSVRFSSGILYQPLMAILMVSPVAGIMMKKGKG
ncbi:MAG TPA: hypothetical protein PLM71_08405 [Syntrophorhabdaceae bacterium]|nr:hypothetical protein [Syntrophorhabdaceae bacterium]